MSKNHRLLKHLLAFILVTPLAGNVTAKPPENFDEQIEKVRQSAGVLGMAIAIVEQGEVTLVKGYGTQKLGGEKPVDDETLFLTGSTGKAVTVAGLALLVDQGRIGWDDKVIDHIPWFRICDPYVTREMTIRDLLVHRSGLGLGAGDLLFVPRTNLTRKEAVQRLAHIKPETSFRYGYAYDNILYMVAGQLIEEVTGQTWEDYIAEHIFAQAGMNDSTAASESRFASEDRAFPHARLNGGLRGTGKQEMLNERDELGRTAAPAGSLAMSARDMATWLQIQLAHGKMPNGKRLFSEASSKKNVDASGATTNWRNTPVIGGNQVQFRCICIGLGCERLSRCKDRIPWRRSVWVQDRRGHDPRQACRFCSHDKFRRRLSSARYDV